MATEAQEDLWIFGYSSLLWKYSDVVHTRSVFGYIDGYVRRFWQGSTDHRGTPSQPGLVASLYTPADLSALKVPLGDEGLRVHGRAFLVSGGSRASVISSLNDREVDGYDQRWVPVYSADTGKILVQKALVYMAPITNEQFAGVLSPRDITDRIVRCHGDSGSNRVYLVNLVDALRKEGVSDPHLNELVNLLPPLTDTDNTTSIQKQ